MAILPLMIQGSAACAAILESILTTLLILARRNGAGLPNPSSPRKDRPIDDETAARPRTIREG